MGTPRTYVSKIENQKATPTLKSLERVARGLGVSVTELLSGGERARQDHVGDFLSGLSGDAPIPVVLPTNMVDSKVTLSE